MTSINARLALAFTAIFLLALVPRLAVAFQFDDPPATTNDAGWYDFFGMQIAQGHGYTLPFGGATSRWPPGYPYFLGGVYKATGDSRAAARVAQAVLALFAWWWATGYWRAPDGRATSLRAAALVASLALTLVRWTLRNAVELDTFAPVSTNLGMNLWLGNNPAATGTVMNPPMADFVRKTAGPSNPELEVRTDALARDAALRYVAHHPLTAISRVPDKLLETYRDDSVFNIWYDPSGRNYLDATTESRISWLTNVTYAFVLAAAAAGSALLFRERSPALAMVLAALLAWSAVSAVLRRPALPPPDHAAAGDPRRVRPRPAPRRRNAARPVTSPGSDLGDAPRSLLSDLRPLPLCPLPY